MPIEVDRKSPASSPPSSPPPSPPSPPDSPSDCARVVRQPPPDPPGKCSIPHCMVEERVVQHWECFHHGIHATCLAKMQMIGEEKDRCPQCRAVPTKCFYDAGCFHEDDADKPCVICGEKAGQHPVVHRREGLAPPEIAATVRRQPPPSPPKTMEDVLNELVLLNQIPSEIAALILKTQSSTPAEDQDGVPRGNRDEGGEHQEDQETPIQHPDGPASDRAAQQIDMAALAEQLRAQLQEQQQGEKNQPQQQREEDSE